jgi:TatD DNase family protein
MNLIDTHCHLYSDEFKEDVAEAIQRAVTLKVNTILLPAIDEETHQRLIDLAAKQHDGCSILPMMGVHPCSIKENFEEELAVAKSFLNNGTKYCAVGEIGLDFYWDVEFKAQQIIAFERQIEWAVERSLPIVIHSRKSTYECIQSVKKYKGKVSGVFHCFSGSKEEAEEIKKLGFLMGIGGVATYKNSGLKELLPNIGLENIVLETDSPYLSPVPHRGKRNEPAHIRLIAEAVAVAFNLPLDEIARQTTANAQRLFKL